MTQIHVKVEPDSSEFKIETGYMPKIYLENKAENGRANAELLNRLEKILGERPGIMSGHKSRRKKLKTSLDEEEFRRRLGEI
jgi:uncharacterized protein YggU (UPF0235/DUF167 family)